MSNCNGSELGLRRLTLSQTRPKTFYWASNDYSTASSDCLVLTKATASPILNYERPMDQFFIVKSCFLISPEAHVPYHPIHLVHCSTKPPEFISMKDLLSKKKKGRKKSVKVPNKTSMQKCTDELDNGSPTFTAQRLRVGTARS